MAAQTVLSNIGDGRVFGLRINGSGDPTVILTPLIGAERSGWLGFQDQKIGDLTRSIAYEHAGFGQSSPGPLPRRVSRNVSDLRSALADQGIQPPYILVGYSAGAFDALYFALTRPDDVCGILLVDPSALHMGLQMHHLSDEVEASDEKELADLRAGVAVLTQSKRRDDMRARLSELECFYGESSTEISELLDKGLGDIPLVVMSSDGIPINDEDQRQRVLPVWRKQHQTYAALSCNGGVMPVEGEHHELLDLHNETMLEIVKIFVDRARDAVA